jgi:osmotically-inducible protein OsmY
MDENHLEKSWLVKAAGLVLGIVIGGPLGPIVFTPLGLNIPASATAGSFVGAILGYALTSALISMERWRRDRELRRAAEAVRAEAGLSQSITIHVKDGRITLGGEVADLSQRHKAEQVMPTLPGIKGVTNKIHLQPSSQSITVSPDEIRQQIEKSFVRRAELEGQGIRVMLTDSRLVLQGTVSSWVEASEAEEVAWHTPGVADVENRLQVSE